jgi:uncharacterized membrane protein YhaH (DUF805 family)
MLSLFALIVALSRFLDLIFTNIDSQDYISSFMAYTFILYLGVAGILTLLMKIRRLHDLNLSGGWLLLGGIPIISFILLIYLLCRKGDPHPNRFGEIAVAPKLGLFDKIMWVLAILYMGGILIF